LARLNPIRRGVKSLILDHIEKHELSAIEADRHFDALMALARLGEGLFWLDRTIRDLERRATINAAPEDVKLSAVGFSGFAIFRGPTLPWRRLWQP